MKYRKTIIVVLFLTAVVFPSWAQIAGSTDIVYAAGYRSSFSYSLGLNTMMNNSRFYLENFNLNGASSNQAERKGIYDGIGMGAVFLAEWKYFILGFSMYYHFEAINIEEIRNISHDVGLNFQTLFRLPLITRLNFTLALSTGGQLAFSRNFGISAVTGIDFGFRITPHHFLFIGQAINVPLMDINGHSIFAGASSLLYRENKFDILRNDGLPWGWQGMVGIRTQVYKRTFNFSDNRVE